MAKSKSFYNSLTPENENQSHFQLPLFGDDKHSQNPTPRNRRNKTKGGLFKKRAKPQISSITGLPVTRKDRYCVTLGDEILGEFLAIDEALELAAKGGKA